MGTLRCTLLSAPFGTQALSASTEPRVITSPEADRSHRGPADLEEDGLGAVAVVTGAEEVG